MRLGWEETFFHLDSIQSLSKQENLRLKCIFKRVKSVSCTGQTKTLWVLLFKREERPVNYLCCNISPGWRCSCTSCRCQTLLQTVRHTFVTFLSCFWQIDRKWSVQNQSQVRGAAWCVCAASYLVWKSFHFSFLFTHKRLWGCLWSVTPSSDFLCVQQQTDRRLCGARGVSSPQAEWRWSRRRTGPASPARRFCRTAGCWCSARQKEFEFSQRAASERRRTRGRDGPSPWWCGRGCWGGAAAGACSGSACGSWGWSSSGGSCEEPLQTPPRTQTARRQWNSVILDHNDRSSWLIRFELFCVWAKWLEFPSSQKLYFQGLGLFFYLLKNVFFFFQIPESSFLWMNSWFVFQPETALN